MKKLMTTLFASSILLMGCGADEAVESAEDITETDTEEAVQEAITEEQKDDESSSVMAVVEEPDPDFEESDFELEEKNEGEHAYLDNTDTSDIENRVTDASDIAGLYAATVKDDSGTYYNSPTMYLLEIHEDGRFTQIEMTYPELEYNADDDTLVDVSLNRYLDANTEASASQKNTQQLRRKSFLRQRRPKVQFIDENNTLQYATGHVPTFDSIQVYSGHLVEAFGNVQLHAIEQRTFYAHFNEQGELDYSMVHNPTSSSNPLSISAKGLVDNDGGTFDTDLYDSTDLSYFAHDILTNNGSLKSAHQIHKELEDDAAAREIQKSNNGELGDSQLYFESNSELLDFLYRRGYLNEVITDTADFVGYTEDNRELEPDVVFSHSLMSTRYFALFEDGQTMEFKDSDNTWHPVAF